MIDKDNIFKEINEGIVNERYNAFKRNLDKNMGYIRRYGGLQRVVSRLRDKSIIIVGAGPSLEDDFSILKRFQYIGEIIIISTDMALAPLIKSGIYPQYVITCETIPVDYFGSICTEQMHLLAFSCMSNTNLRKWKGDISFYNWMIHNPLYDELWEKAGNLGYVATGSIVTTQAVSFALGCDIRSLMLIGNDLGFGREFYIRDTIVFNKHLSRSNRFLPMESVEFNTIWEKREYIISRGERRYYTNNQFLAAKLWLEELFTHINTPIYDGSDLGCSEKSVRKIRLNEFLGMFERRPKKKRR